MCAYIGLNGSVAFVYINTKLDLIFVCIISQEILFFCFILLLILLHTSYNFFFFKLHSKL